MPVVVASIGRWPIDAPGTALEGIDALELRLDLIGASLERLPAIVSVASGLTQRVIATCRPGAVPEAARVALLCEAAKLGAWAVDVEADAPAASRAAVARAARACDCRLIVSYHNHEVTPARQALRRIVHKSVASGADYVKIACCVRALADNAVLLGLLDDESAAGRVAVMGTGPLGWVTRFVAPLLGSPLVYVALGPGLETADGQPTREALLRAWTALGIRP